MAVTEADAPTTVPTAVVTAPDVLVELAAKLVGCETATKAARETAIGFQLHLIVQHTGLLKSYNVLRVAQTAEGGIEFVAVNGGARARVEVFSDGALNFVSFDRQGVSEHWPIDGKDFALAANRMFDAIGLIRSNDDAR